MRVKKQFLKVMNKIDVWVFAIFFLIILNGCTNKNRINYSKEISFINQSINQNIQYFKELDSIDCENNLYYQHALTVIEKTNFIIAKLNNSDYLGDSINSLSNYCISFCNIEQQDVKDLEIEKKIDYDLLQLKLRLLENMAISSLLNRYRNNFYYFSFVKPIVVPQKNTVKVGEEFVATIYLVGANEGGIKRVNINEKDCNFEDEDPYNPVFRLISTKKGLNKLNGYIIFKNPFKGDLKYDIKYDYIVN